MPPNVVVAAQMDALQLNDYPEIDASVQAAYLFAKPYGCEELTVGQVQCSAHAIAKHGWLHAMCLLHQVVLVRRFLLKEHVHGMQRRHGSAIKSSGTCCTVRPSMCS